MFHGSVGIIGTVIQITVQIYTNVSDGTTTCRLDGLIGQHIGSSESGKLMVEMRFDSMAAARCCSLFHDRR